MINFKIVKRKTATSSLLKIPACKTYFKPRFYFSIIPLPREDIKTHFSSFKKGWGGWTMSSGRCYLTAISFHANSTDFDYQLYSICHQFQGDKMHSFLPPCLMHIGPIHNQQEEETYLPFSEKWKKALIFRKMSWLCPSKNSWLHASSSKSTDKSTK